MVHFSAATSPASSSHISKTKRSILSRPAQYNPSVFVLRFVNRAQVVHGVAAVGFYYLHRVRKHIHEDLVQLGVTDPSHLVLAALTLAAKYYDDQALHMTNRHWANLGGCKTSLELLNQLEKLLLRRLDYALFIDPADFLVYCEKYEIEQHVQNI
eukprot:TRINITY_DN2834_c0_g1_i1.p2 TRINITY_DN2834_c0_g1~~TRINITY_DN2834_c0_g1_i1.p2  ORF type:complete len:155 (-),score=43.08 TRINITY_DN2834_c0_g1_i1:137-601(-)